MNFNTSKRQFKRDLEDIGSIFEIEINYDFKRRVYDIDEELQSEVSRRRLEAFDTFNVLKIGENTSYRFNLKIDVHRELKIFLDYSMPLITI